MSVKKGTWVEVHRTVLQPDERAPQVPDDTKKVSLEMRVKGFLNDDADIGEDVDIITPAGRNLSGKLVDVNPAYTHQFGSPIPELSRIGMELRALLFDEERI